MDKIRCSRCKKFYEPKFVSLSKQPTWTPENNSMQSICRDCGRKKQRKYTKTEKGRRVIRKAGNDAYQKHKHKWIARAKARYAVQKGLIIKPKKCEVCELIKPLQGHHEDYSKPLEVIWLCQSCHAEADKLSQPPKGRKTAPNKVLK
jgi:hypothetical protein